MKSSISERLVGCFYAFLREFGAFSSCTQVVRWQKGLGTVTLSPRLQRSCLLPRAYSIVRGAMVSVLLAGASLQHHHHPRTPLPSPSSPGLVEEDIGGVRHAVDGSSDATDDSAWSSALGAESGSGVLPRDPSTCVLWCAIALGALVRGVPLDHVSFSWHIVDVVVERRNQGRRKLQVHCQHVYTRKIGSAARWLEISPVTWFFSGGALR